MRICPGCQSAFGLYEDHDCLGHHFAHVELISADDLARLRTELESARAALAEAREVLQRVEWRGPTDGEFKHHIAHSCPYCGAPNALVGRHAPECRLAAVLGR
jgi:hypothetical protein